ncbi:MAG: nitrogen fixation protein NifH [Chloroflexi bacterium]|nr:nitrogen fixation protein NifH [Chloroflexota bacterium]
MNNIFDWLLELDNPSVRYFALRHLLDRPEDDPEIQAARRAIMTSEPVQKILAAQAAEGYWGKPGKGYSPKYCATSWQLLFLAELGADGENDQVRKGCEYFLDQSPTKHGGFDPLVYCLNGNMLWALTQLGVADDERFGRAVDWLTGMITGELPHTGSYSWPGFGCGANDKLPCAWGAVKALRALTNLHPTLQSPKVKKAAEASIEFLFSRDLAKADYPVYKRISGEWFKFGFPLSYTSDVLEAAFVLCEAGHGNDPRLRNAIDLIISKRQSDGRWLLKHSLNGKMWADIEVKGKPSKWITLRALRVLKASEKEK